MLKRPQQLLIACAVCAAIALGSTAIAEAAMDRSDPFSTPVTVQVEAGPAVLASGGGGTIGAANRAGASWIADLDLSDHEQYLRHHRRLELSA
jgi:hypothetical protein